jgi:hypothetical protein
VKAVDLDTTDEECRVLFRKERAAAKRRRREGKMSREVVGHAAEDEALVALKAAVNVLVDEHGWRQCEVEELIAEAQREKWGVS